MSLVKETNGNYRVSLSSGPRVIGAPGQRVSLNIRRGKQLEGSVQIIFLSNPTKVEGMLAFNEEFTYSAARYVDGELGRLILPEGYTIKVDAPAYPEETEAQWLKACAVEEATNTYRIVAGWRPNDVKAKGQDQSGKIIITQTATGRTECYTVVRKNWTLPVVEFAGTWWCKYNLRGNVKRFEDQILMGNEPNLHGKTLAQYMNDCTPEELVRLMGGQYQGGNPDELKLVYENGSFTYQGFANNPPSFASLSPTAMAPDGFQIPENADFRFFSGSENFNLGQSGSKSYGNGLSGNKQHSFTATIYKRKSLPLLGGNFDEVRIYDFASQSLSDAHWVLASLGHQYEPKKIASMMQLYAVHFGKTWLMEGHADETGRGNWFKLADQNSKKTRSIRCIKTPVEFIY